MSLFLREDVAKSPAMYLLDGLCPHVCRYLTGRPKLVTKQPIKPTPVISPRPQQATTADGGAADEQGPPKGEITDVSIKTSTPAKQRVSHPFIKPHPLVTFAEVSVNLGGRSEAPVQAVSTPQQARKSKGKEHARTSPHKFSTSIDLEPPKRSNRRSLPTFALDHSRNVSSSSDETLVGSPHNSSSKSFPVASDFAQGLQDAAEKIIHDKQNEKVRRLEEEAQKLRTRLSRQTKRADELQDDLKICKRERETNFNIALWFYRRLGVTVLVERSNLIDEVSRLRFEVQERETLILSRDELVQALYVDLTNYASQEKWNQMRQAFYDLAQQYGQMPQNLRDLEQNYRDLEDIHIDVCNKTKDLQGDYTELRVQHDQIKSERDQLEHDAETLRQSSRDAKARIWALEVECNQFLERKTKADQTAKDQEQFLKGLAGRMFKRVVSTAIILANMDIEPKDDEMTALCQLACKHLGFSPSDIADSLLQTRTEGNSGLQNEPRQDGTPEFHNNNISRSMFTSDSTSHWPTISIKGADHASMNTPIRGNDMLESPNTFHARRQSEIAAAEEALLGPLGLGFQDDSPTLKTKAAIENSKSPKKSKFMGLFPKLRETPSKPEVNVTSGAGDIDQVTPARTGGTRGIARDQWKTAAQDLEDFTKVFKGLRAQPIDIISPSTGTKGAAGGSPRQGNNIFETNEGGRFFGSIGDHIRDDSTEKGEGIEIDLDNAEDDSVLRSEGGEASRPIDEAEYDDDRLYTATPKIDKASTTPSLPKDVFNPPQLQDFDFGSGNSSGFPSIKKDESLGQPASSPKPATIGIFNFSNSLPTQASNGVCDTPSLEQDINFGGTDSGSQPTGAQKAAPSPQPTILESEPGGTSSPSRPSSSQNVPSTGPQVEEKAAESSNASIEQDRTEAATLLSIIPTEEKPNVSSPKTGGMNRKQRREAERERKAADQKVQAAAEKARGAARKKKQGGRTGVTKAMLKERLGL